MRSFLTWYDEENIIDHVRCWYSAGTNMRNCVRLIFRYGMPIDKPCIYTTTAGQSMMITTTLAARCQKELNEVPFKAGKHLSETDAEFIPVIDALHIDPTGPLDA